MYAVIEPMPDATTMNAEGVYLVLLPSDDPDMAGISMKTKKELVEAGLWREDIQLHPQDKERS